MRDPDSDAPPAARSARRATVSRITNANACRLRFCSRASVSHAPQSWRMQRLLATTVMVACTTGARVDESTCRSRLMASRSLRM